MIRVYWVTGYRLQVTGYGLRAIEEKILKPNDHKDNPKTLIIPPMLSFLRKQESMNVVPS